MKKGSALQEARALPTTTLWARQKRGTVSCSHDAERDKSNRPDNHHE